MQNLADKKVKTRKPHRCHGCIDIIPTGTTVRYTANVDGGRVAGAYWCDRCDAFMDTLPALDLEDGITEGEFKYMDGYPLANTKDTGGE